MFYNSLLLSLNKRFSRGLQFQAAYTLSKNVTDNDTEVAGPEYENFISTQDPLDLKGSRGLSVLDTRHNLVLNYSYDLPFGQRWLGGWQIGGIVSFSSGFPLTPQLGFDNARQITRRAGDSQRPDLNPGKSNNPVLGNPNQWFDPLAFGLPPAGFFGNLGRNTVSGPGVTSIDFSLNKNTQLREATHLQFRAEFFNMANHPNFRTPSTAIFSSRGRLGDAGRITGTRTSGRQIQFGLKLQF